MNNVPWYFVLLTLTTAQLLTDAADTSELIDTIFLRYYEQSLDNYIDFPLGNASNILSKLDKNKTTVCYIHGFSESADKESVKTVVTGFLKRGDHNILAADYRNISSMWYLQVVHYASDVGAAIAGTFNEMHKAGFDPENLYVVGHSLGAQIASYIGNKTNFQIPRITGLDPAGPLFNFFERHLSSKDARFVDVSHTDLGLYGEFQINANADFFPNKGRRIQPGCPSVSLPLSNDDFCSHHRSWKFYAESLTNPNAFIAVKCSSYLQFVTGSCNNNEKVPMGYGTPPTTKGKYYLVTGSSSPFGLGAKGAKP